MCSGASFNETEGNPYLMLILILQDLYAIMQYVACVKLVGIELATSLPVQYGIRNCSSWTRYRRGDGRVSRTVYTYVPYPLLP